MVRKQVENLRGLILTPEELDIIYPIVVKSLEEISRHNVEPHWDKETKENEYGSKSTASMGAN